MLNLLWHQIALYKGGCGHPILKGSVRAARFDLPLLALLFSPFDFRSSPHFCPWPKPVGCLKEWAPSGSRSFALVKLLVLHILQAATAPPCKGTLCISQDFTLQATETNSDCKRNS